MSEQRVISIIGLGRVGLPLALSFADRGLRVLGVDHDPAILGSIRAGRMPFQEAGTQELLERVLQSGRLDLTERAADAAQADVDGRKRIFAQHVMTYVPLAAYIKRVLDERTSHHAPATRFRDELEDHMSEETAEQTLRAVTSWARYGEAFAYDEGSGVFSLENPS